MSEVIESSQTGNALAELPELSIILVGQVQSSNLSEFKQSAIAIIKSINTDLKTDEDFATAENVIKFCTSTEQKLEAFKAKALEQTASIADVFKATDELKEEVRKTRLALNRQVTDRKEEIRRSIELEAKNAIMTHIDGINKRLGKVQLPAIYYDFAGAMKGKKTIDSLKAAANSVLTTAILEANSLAEKIETNLQSLRELAKDHAFLFSDAQQLVLKNNDDLVNIIKVRIEEHTRNEAERLEREREAIRKQEAEKLQLQNQAINTQDEVKRQPEVSKPLHLDTSAAPVIVNSENIQKQENRPSDDQIIYSLSLRFGVEELHVIGWLAEVDLQAAYDTRVKGKAA